MDERVICEGNFVLSSKTQASATSPCDVPSKDEGNLSTVMESININEEDHNELNKQKHEAKNLDQVLKQQEKASTVLDGQNLTEVNQLSEGVTVEEKDADPVFDGTEAPELETDKAFSSQNMDPADPEVQVYAWPEKAVALRNFVREKSAVAVSTMLRRLSSKKNQEELGDYNDIVTKGHDKDQDVETDSKENKVSPKDGEQSLWNPLNFMKIRRNADSQSKTDHLEHASFDNLLQETIQRRIIVYTRLGCQECRMVRSLLNMKRLKYVEINIDIFPTRKLELEKRTGSSVVPKVYLNDFLVGGLDELKAMDESGQLDEKIKDLFIEESIPTAPLPPLPGEDDESGNGTIDDMASIVRKMKESIIIKDRFYKMRRFSNCFVGSEAVNFLSEDQYFEREEAVEFGRKLVGMHFFQHITNENIFEDGSHLYRFLEHDPVIMTQCYNFPRGVIEVKPKPITEIASRLRFLSYAIIEAYVSEDGRHVDYRSIHSCEEFKRYLRTIEELQRVDLEPLSREEKLAFFINLYNMMAIHAILTLGFPARALERRTFFGDFKYVIGGCAYSLSAIHNGILRGNQRPPYNITKPFGQRDKRIKVAFPYPEPLVHFALVCGTRSGPALRCYSPGNIDKELIESARDFIKTGGLFVDSESSVASITKILRWYSVDFGKNEVEVLKHAANYLEPQKSEDLLELLSSTQLKVTYQPYDWSANY
ncbi:uncharacterized protein LOC122006260 isoform X1 [Zingiber officinale]|uniref:uncharacterized protein LOC122006260 isoform X1 n=1 Tax=Zingiber officinale TaxID=94328 RepID=UPI001C4B68C6|nr:uncharacterized protein LOC122006260 isoform X1 [Zingiber officinale]